MSSEAEPVRAWLIAGFRGAGKSALMQSLAGQRPIGTRIAILAQGIAPAAWPTSVDPTLLDVETAAPGCPCCSGSLPFRVALIRLLRRRQPGTALLLIEGSAEAHVASVKATLSGAPFAGLVRLAGTVAVIDLAGFEAADAPARARIAQLCAAADRVVANKTDLASGRARSQLAQLCGELEPAPAYVEAVAGAVALQWLLQPSDGG